MKPLILINFKNYVQSTGQRAVSLVKQLNEVRVPGYQLAVAPALLDLRSIVEVTKLSIFAPHADAVEAGPFTGKVSVKALKELGVTGVLLNHSEDKISFSELQKIRKLCAKYHLQTVMCASTLTEVTKIAALKPEYIAYEPQELIGGNVSVTDAKPEILTKVVKKVRVLSPGTLVLCGAGIHTKEDVLTALQLGARGVLLAHAVVMSRRPKVFLEKSLW